MLHEVSLASLESDAARYAFWVNIYNALVRHAFQVLDIRGSLVRNLNVFNRAAWVIARQRYSVNIIEHGLLRGNARVAPHYPFRTVRSNDPRLCHGSDTTRLSQYFRRDFGDRARALGFAAQYFDSEGGGWLLDHLADVDIEYALYDWTTGDAYAVIC